MATDSGYFIHSIKNNGATSNAVTTNATVNTNTTGAGNVLGDGATAETFTVTVGSTTTTYTYLGKATAGSTSGFYARDASNNQHYFSKTDAGNNAPVSRTADVPGAGANDTVICFFPGTMIATPAGEVAVETLKIGDLVLTSEGKAAPVRWMGRQTVSTLFADKQRVLPIRVAAGALGENMPVRDLLVSPDHALLVDGVLVQAGALVNGSTIRQEAAVPTAFTYHHVELADHSLILAEGAPAETFVDNIDRLAFDNWDEHEALYGDLPSIPELALPRAKSARQVPMAIRQKLAERAAQGAEAVAA